MSNIFWKRRVNNLKYSRATNSRSYKSFLTCKMQTKLHIFFTTWDDFLLDQLCASVLGKHFCSHVDWDCLQQQLCVIIKIYQNNCLLFASFPPHTKHTAASVSLTVRANDAWHWTFCYHQNFLFFDVTVFGPKSALAKLTNQGISKPKVNAYLFSKSQVAAVEGWKKPCITDPHFEEFAQNKWIIIRLYCNNKRQKTPAKNACLSKVESSSPLTPLLSPVPANTLEHFYFKGERLSHAVGCAFAACLEKKQKREKESVTATFNQNRTTFTREGSFRVKTITEQQEELNKHDAGRWIFLPNLGGGSSGKKCNVRSINFGPCLGCDDTRDFFVTLEPAVIVVCLWCCFDFL